MSWPAKSAFNRKIPKKAKRYLTPREAEGHGLAERVRKAIDRDKAHERAVAKILRGAK